jgi:hypothetical protein
VTPDVASGGIPVIAIDIFNRARGSRGSVNGRRPAAWRTLATVHLPTWIIGPAIKVGEKVYEWLGSRFGTRVEADLGIVGQGQSRKMP